MNLIKLKDVIKEGDDFFNKYLKGRYAYWIHMRYIVPFDLMRHEGYVACEENIEKLLKKEDGTYPKPYGCPYIDMCEDCGCNITKYIDIAETDKINCITLYKLHNEYVSDNDITIEELKKFRTWLATQLLKFDENNKEEQCHIMYTDEETHVLEYYKKGMYDLVVKYLSEFGKTDINLNMISMDTCGCAGSSNLSSLYNTSLTICDTLAIYRKNIYNKMVEMFSPIDFWTKYPAEFIKEFKKYIDNILKCNFKLTKCDYISDFVDCGCDKTDEQAAMQVILRRLSQALQYIIDGSTRGYKNFINDALRDWSRYLYEQMEW